MFKIRFLAPALAGLLTLSLHCRGDVLVAEKFATNPSADGWRIFGTNNLFAWNQANQDLDVDWDSSKPNNYFYHPLGAAYSRTNDFVVAFDLRLRDDAGGVDTNKPTTFQISIGLMNLAEATNDGFIIGSGYQAADLVEFTYYPNEDYDTYGETISTPVISTMNAYAGGGFTFPLALDTNVLYHVVMTYTAANATLHCLLHTNGVPAGALEDTVVGATFDDFSVDTLAVSSYSDEGQDPDYPEGSMLAHGAVGNLVFASPLPVYFLTATNAGTVRFQSSTNWNYVLDEGTNFLNWSPVSPLVHGTGTNLVLQATNLPSGTVFYRVRAELP